MNSGNQHSGGKPYDCDLCRLVISIVEENNINVMHTSNKPHKCNLCKKTFTGHLKWHMLTHTGDKLYECNVGGKTFMHTFNLRPHMLTLERNTMHV